MGDFRKATDQAKVLFAELSEGMDGERKAMFGCPCLFLEGNMVSGTYAERIFFRVLRDEQAAVLKTQPGLSVFEPMPGRPMRDYLAMEALPGNRRALADLLARSWAEAQNLPPKVKKGRKP